MIKNIILVLLCFSISSCSLQKIVNPEAKKYLDEGIMYDDQNGISINLKYKYNGKWKFTVTSINKNKNVQLEVHNGSVRDPYNIIGVTNADGVFEFDIMSSGSSDYRITVEKHQTFVDNNYRAGYKIEGIVNE